MAARPHVSLTSGPTMPCARPRPSPRPAALALRFSSVGPAACAREGAFTALVPRARPGSWLLGGMRAPGTGPVRSRFPHASA